MAVDDSAGYHGRMSVRALLPVLWIRILAGGFVGFALAGIVAGRWLLPALLLAWGMAVTISSLLLAFNVRNSATTLGEMRQGQSILRAGKFLSGQIGAGNGDTPAVQSFAACFVLAGLLLVGESFDSRYLMGNAAYHAMTAVALLYVAGFYVTWAGSWVLDRTGLSSSRV